MTIVLIDGKPHRECSCAQTSEICAQVFGHKRTPQTTGYARCLVPAPDAVVSFAPSASASLKALAEQCRPAVQAWAHRAERAVLHFDPSKQPSHYKPALQEDAIRADKVLAEIDAILANDGDVSHVEETTSPAAEEYKRRNPMGDPAKVFEMMALRIRAGEDYYSVLDDYGFQVKDAAPANVAERLIASQQEPCDDLRRAAAVAAKQAGEPLPSSIAFTKEDAAKLVERKARALTEEYCHGDGGPDGYTWTNKEAEWQVILLEELAEEFRNGA